MYHYATALRSSDPSQRRAAVKELCELGDAAPLSALNYVGPLLHDPDEVIREGAMETVLNLSKTAGTVTETVLQHLTELLAASGASRIRILRMIGRIGPNARSLIPTLEAALKASDPLAARMTAVALVGIGNESIPALKAALNDPTPLVRSEASRALGKITGKALPSGDVDQTWRPGEHGGR
jgi:hypothetical protein